MRLKKINPLRWKWVLIVGVIAACWAVVPSMGPTPWAESEETYQGLKLFSDVIELIEKNYVDPVDSKDLIEKAINGMVNSLDPHSSFLPPEAFKELQVDTRGEFGGIGIVISLEKGMLTVISPIEGTPAHKAGIKAGDQIIKINDESTKDMALWEAVKRMRGPKKTTIRITILREGEGEPKEYTLIRDIIPIESVKHKVLTTGYGYVRITNFNENTTRDLTAALQELESGTDGFKGLVVDLRDNPGGLLNQAIEVADVFLEEGVVVSIKGRDKKHNRTYNAHPDKVKRKYPIVVLINEGSASASEIVAGALQDHKKAVIMGTASFGKGSVQTVEALRDGYGLKYTIARYYTPSGKSIQAQGIVPDIEVKPMILAEKEKSKTASGLFREKDLKNHLEAVPGKEEDESTSPEDTGPESKRPDSRSRFGPLDIEMLKKDYQVRRALETLISFEIFKNIRG